MPDLDASPVGAMTPGHYGAAGTAVVLAQALLTAAWNVQGDPARPSFLAHAQQLFGVPLPLEPNTASRGMAATALWLGPGSWWVVEHAGSEPASLTGFETRRDALNLHGGALFELAASRVAFTVRGARAATVLARSCPLDFHPSAFPPGRCAQSVYGRINALFYRHAETPAFTVMVARSFAADAWKWLCWSAATDGYEVAAPAPFDGA